MDAPPVATKRPPWGLDDAEAADIQGLVVSPFEHLPAASALFLELAPRSDGAWLAALVDDGMVTPATGKTEPSVAIALTWSGLARMGLPQAALQTFDTPFRDGMTDAYRRHRLGDDDPAGLWQGTLRWSGNVPAARDAVLGVLAGDAPTTPVTVHAVLLLYARDADALAALDRRARDLVEPHGALVSFALPLWLRPEAGGGPPREHFGFADGMSQPLPHLLAAARDRLHGVSVGEVLMGYQNAHDERAPGPVVAAATDPRNLLARPVDAADAASLGDNGSYLVVRQLHQDVAAFRAGMERAAETCGDPSITAEWFAERVVGRQRDGDLLVPGGALPAVDGAPDNAFGYFAKDRYGRGCPIGSHIRRSNPRDGLAKDESACESVRRAANNHRLLRRGRKYGEVLAEGAADDGAERGLLFMTLQTDIARQFEFVQQTWLNNTVFATMVGETDPLVGRAGPFTLPADPIRRIVHVDTFVQLVGGEYFFLPSLRALRYLGTL